ncbi:MAG TPA: CcmD family protein [Candidatus Binataceae bacterium]|nr:CcmD family protein [Candidatus Binataceae bacterium]
MDNLGYLFAAYSIIFAAIFFYVMFLWRRQAQLDHKIRGLENQLNKIRDSWAEGTPSESTTASDFLS